MKANHHHIQRLDGTPPPAGNGATGWRVRWFDGEGRRRVRTFADTKHGGAEAALKRAIAFRDRALTEAETTRQARIAQNFVPALSPAERRQLRARMIEADCRGYNRHIRLRVPVGGGRLAQRCFGFRDHGSARRAFAAALRFRDRIERLSPGQRKEALA